MIKKTVRNLWVLFWQKFETPLTRNEREVRREKGKEREAREWERIKTNSRSQLKIVYLYLGKWFYRKLKTYSSLQCIANVTFSVVMQIYIVKVRCASDYIILYTSCVYWIKYTESDVLRFIYNFNVVFPYFLILYSFYFSFERKSFHRLSFVLRYFFKYS